MSTYFPDTSSTAAKLLTIVSYLPIALYAENLRVERSIVSALCNPLSIPCPVTGCIKDLERLWNIRPCGLFDGSEAHAAPVVSSLRHGNNFPLVNKTILGLLGMSGKLPPQNLDDPGPSSRLTVVNMTFLAPRRRKTKERRRLYFWKLFIISTEIVAMTLLGLELAHLGLYVAAALIGCLTFNTLILAVLEQLVSVGFAHATQIEEDSYITAARGAPLDVHVVAQNWNASTLDVLIGYSSQLHSLSNLSARVTKGRWAIKCATRLLAITLTLQAALLTSLVSNASEQTVGSAIWLCCYFIMHIPPWLFAKLIKRSETMPQKDAHHTAELVQPPPAHFSGRRAALAFIATLPHTSKAGRWDWINGFIPPDARRRQWEKETESLGLFNPVVAATLEAANHGRVCSKYEHTLIADVRRAQKDEGFLAALNEYQKAVGLAKSQSSTTTTVRSI